MDTHSHRPLETASLEVCGLEYRWDLDRGSFTIGNVPSVILLLKLWPAPAEGALYALALLSTFAGNLFLVGSLANIIVAERAAAVGVRLGFGVHARAGVPITLISTALGAAWLWLIGAVPF